MVSRLNINSSWERVCRRCEQSFSTQIPTLHFCSVHCRFYAKVDVRLPDECWNWKTGVHNKAGYGSFSYNGRARYAHRVSLELKLGRPLKKGEVACHRCDNPSCVNPNHLFSGTTRDNARDAIKKGRLPWQKKTHCKNGHPWTPEATYSYGKYRTCKICQAARTMKWAAKKKDKDNGRRLARECKAAK